MNDFQIKLKLKEIFRELCPEIPFDELDLSRPLRNQIEIDSYDFYRIIVQISERTGVYIPDSKIAELANLKQLIEYISKNSSTENRLSAEKLG